MPPAVHLERTTSELVPLVHALAALFEAEDYARLKQQENRANAAGIAPHGTRG